MVDYTALQAEIKGDPAGLGYAPYLAAGSDNKIADLLNAVSALQTVFQPALSPVQLFGAIVWSEFSALNVDQKQLIQIALALPFIDFSNANIRNGFGSAFGPGTQTRANIAALISRSASRAEKLFGAGIVVTAEDIARALRG